jgi:hypothetical protein
VITVGAYLVGLYAVAVTATGAAMVWAARRLRDKFETMEGQEQ